MALVVGLVIVTALALPLAGMFFFRIYENQLIHQTEADLIGQTAVLAAVMAREIEAQPSGLPLGAAVPPAPADPDIAYRPILPSLDLARDPILGRRPAAEAAPTPAAPAFAALGARLAADLVAVQKITLAGFRLLDPHGVVIAGREELGLSLAHVQEVAAALDGQFSAVMRLRVSKHEPPPLYSLSRGTSVRLFVAMPVVVDGRVGGVVYASRTPSNVFKSFHQERGKLAAAGLTILALAALIGFIFQRTITRPIRELMKRTEAIGRGDRASLAPLAHHGTAEFAALSQGFLDTAQALQDRSDFIATFAAHVSHELKSPLTAIKGAAELLRDDLDAITPGMDRADQRRFLDHIISDTARLATIVQRLRELARAEGLPTAGTTTLAAAVADLRTGFATARIEARGALLAPVRLSPENARIVLSHLADNALRHGARRLDISACREAGMLRVTVRDDGAGISAANRDKIFDNFFTTRRDSGGTGMGLPIVRAMLEAHGGGIALDRSEGPGRGAAFILSLSLAPHEGDRR
ncbi:ATP-binding protein [Xanthobacter sp. AM11]|uniref:sensor histidine kinase n=1 Tax=Xanthobacter sp. AM11 TaxID=3380643 RepID=UPI0039BEDA40